jgi:hypothetical protein
MPKKFVVIICHRHKPTDLIYWFYLPVAHLSMEFWNCKHFPIPSHWYETVKLKRSLNSWVSMTGRQAGRSGFNSRQWTEILLFVTTSRPALRPTPPPLHRVPRHFPPEQCGRWVELTTHLHLEGLKCVELYLHSSISLHGMEKGQFFLHSEAVSVLNTVLSISGMIQWDDCPSVSLIIEGRPRGQLLRWLLWCGHAWCHLSPPAQDGWPT